MLTMGRVGEVFGGGRSGMELDVRGKEECDDNCRRGEEMGGEEDCGRGAGEVL